MLPLLSPPHHHLIIINGNQNIPQMIGLWTIGQKPNTSKSCRITSFLYFKHNIFETFLNIQSKYPELLNNTTKGKWTRSPQEIFDRLMKKVWVTTIGHDVLSQGKPLFRRCGAISWIDVSWFNPTYYSKSRMK